jgi:hypothetical protein
MKNLILKTLVLAALELVLSFTIFGQTRCEWNYGTCIRACNATRDQTFSRNSLRRNQISIQLAQELTQCNIRYLGDPAGRQSCRNEKRAVANVALAELDSSDRQAARDRLNCITECRRQLRECRASSFPVPIDPVKGEVSVDCLEGGPLCRGLVKEFCTMASGACDDCWRSLCGGGDWLIDSELPLKVTLVAVSDLSRSVRVLAISSMRGKRAILNVPRELKLESGEQLYFQYSSQTKPHKAVKVTIYRDRH